MNMNLKGQIKNTINSELHNYRHKRKLQAEIKKFEDPRRIAIWSSVELTREQEKSIDELFIPHYGKKVPYTWHRHYTAYTKHFDPCFIPETLFIPEFEFYMNSNYDYMNVFADKNVLSMIASGVGVRMPETIISRANGILRDKDFNIISWNDITKKMPDTICFAKPTIDSDSGRGCMLVDKNIPSTISDLKAMGDNFVVQERIVCSNSIRQIYPGSVNTFRVMTYIWDNAIQVAPVIMRIGRNGSFLDNAHAGGVFIAVNKDGTLHRSAFTEFKDEYEEHPDTHLRLEHFKIDNFSRVLDSAKKMHSAMPQLGVINWDFTIDDNETPVLIEANTSGGSIWLFQMAWGCGVFENNTVPILEWLKEMNRR